MTDFPLVSVYDSWADQLKRESTNFPSTLNLTDQGLDLDPDHVNSTLECSQSLSVDNVSLENHNKYLEKSPCSSPSQSLLESSYTEFHDDFHGSSLLNEFPVGCIDEQLVSSLDCDYNTTVHILDKQTPSVDHISNLSNVRLTSTEPSPDLIQKFSHSFPSFDDINIHNLHTSSDSLDNFNRKQKNRRKSNHKESVLSCNLESGSSSSVDESSQRNSLRTTEISNYFQGSCSSDSEIDYKSDQISNFSNSSRNGNLYTSLKNVGYNSHYSSENISQIYRSFKTDFTILECNSDIASTLDFQNKRSMKAMDASYERSSTSTSSVTGACKRIDRHIRDIDILELTGVPFSYDKVVNSTNEEFRELKSTSGLDDDQVTVMLDARRRATNRQAAERCRRLKLAARDELAERLAQLRLQRQILTKRLVKARQRRRGARDIVTEEQNRLVDMIQDSNGCKLKPSDWRIRLTNDDELIVVSVRH